MKTLSWLPILSLLVLGASENLHAKNTSSRINNIILVHGAWVDGSGWKGVYDILAKKGYHISIVQEPETSFEADVAAVKRVIAQQAPACLSVIVTAESSSPRRATSHQSQGWLYRGAYA